MRAKAGRVTVGHQKKPKQRRRTKKFKGGSFKETLTAALQFAKKHKVASTGFKLAAARFPKYKNTLLNMARMSQMVGYGYR